MDQFPTPGPMKGACGALPNEPCAGRCTQPVLNHCENVCGASALGLHVSTVRGASPPPVVSVPSNVENVVPGCELPHAVVPASPNAHGAPLMKDVIPEICQLSSPQRAIGLFHNSLA